MRETGSRIHTTSSAHFPATNLRFFFSRLRGGRTRLDLLLDAPLEARPPLLAAEALEAAVHAVLHHGDELLVAEQAVAVVVKDLQG